MAMNLIAQWHARGYGLDVVLYRKYSGSTYVDPHEDEKIAFKDLPNRFPSVRSRDFRRAADEYRDYDNLFAIHLLENLRRYSVRVNDGTKLLEVESSKGPFTYSEAVRVAALSAKGDSKRAGSR
jgi:hypothetical protein